MGPTVNAQIQVTGQNLSCYYFIATGKIWVSDPPDVTIESTKSGFTDLANII